MRTVFRGEGTVVCVEAVVVAPGCVEENSEPDGSIASGAFDVEQPARKSAAQSIAEAESDRMEGTVPVDGYRAGSRPGGVVLP